MVAVDRIIRFSMIVHVTRTSSQAAIGARAEAVLGIVDELNGAMRLLRCSATGRMVKQGISMTHLHVMWRLEESGELPMSRLAEFLDVGLSNATGLIDRMEERGVVERLRESDDRRVVLVRLTPTGQATLDEIQIMKRDLMSEILDRLDAAQLNRLRAALTDLRGAIRTDAIDHPDHFGFGPEHVHASESQPEPAHQAQRREYVTR